MAHNLFLILILNLLMIASSIVPLWNFEASTINLLTVSNSYTHSYDIFTRTSGSIITRIEKTFQKIGNTITPQNKLYIGDTSYNTDWEDLKEVYKVGDYYFIITSFQNIFYLLVIPNIIKCLFIIQILGVGSQVIHSMMEYMILNGLRRQIVMANIQ